MIALGSIGAIAGARRRAGSGPGTGNLVAGETFETPTSGYVLSSWTTSTAGSSTITPTYSTSPAPLYGTQSCRMNEAAAVCGLYRNFTSTGEVWGWLDYSNTNGNGIILTVRAGSSTKYRLAIASAKLQVWDAANNGQANSVSALTNGTRYRIFFHFVPGGSNSRLEAVFVAGESPLFPDFGASDERALLTTGTSTGNVDQFWVGSPTGIYTHEYIVDDINLSSTNNL
jgi:hypothetical protein